MGKLFIGWGHRSITPDKCVNLFGHFAERLTDKVRDPITATALVIGSGKEYAVFVSCDICVVYQEAIKICRKEIKKQIPEINPENVIFNATHTHDAPGLASWVYPPVPEGAMSPDEYSFFFAGRVTEAVKEAWKNRKPGGVSWGYGQAVVGHNRRAAYFKNPSGIKGSSGSVVQGTSAMYGRTDIPLFSHIEGYEDHGVDLLFTFDGEKKLTGTVVNIACTSQETEGLREISADFWHETRCMLRDKFGRNLHVLPQCSAAGDLSPHLMYYKKANERMLKLKGISMRDEIAGRITCAVENVLPHVKKDIKDNLPFSHISKNLKLQRRKITPAELRIVKKEYDGLMKKKPANHKDEYVRFIYMRRCRTAMERYEFQKTKPEYPAEVHVVRLGDIAFATNPFELYIDYGIQMKARSPFMQTFIVQLSGGSSGYLPTERGVKGLGYSASVYDNNVGPEGGQQLVEKTLDMLGKAAKVK
ncbi:MAG TPA: neutral/alkaline non-lysosomal ceramidase N-terminal domain-containing protein [bacterium]|nr:neutral/alkaline non-lysosomal ceramidase N-terminal domain-containing protein [bacterium]